MNFVCHRAARRFAPLTLLLALSAAPTLAQGPGVTGFTGGSIFAGFSSDETVGWRFQALGNANVLALGFWDQTPGTPLAASHEVGLWTDAGVLLGNVTVQTTSTLIGEFRYANLSASIPLTAGQFYRIGARDLLGDGDNYNSGATGITTDPLIAFDRRAVSDIASGFAFPNNTSAGGGRFGPNLILVGASAPEPGSLALAALGGLLLIHRRRRA